MKTSLLLVPLGLALAAPVLTADDDWDISKIDTSKLPPASDKQGVTYSNDIRPIFETTCFGCHGEEKQKGHLRLDSLAALLKGGEDGKVVVPGDSKKSLLVAAVARLNDDIAMPPSHKPGGPGGPGRPDRPGNRPPGGPRGENPPNTGNGGPGGPGGPESPGGQRRSGPPPKPLTAEQVGLIRAWIDQGAK